MGKKKKDKKIVLAYDLGLKQGREEGYAEGFADAMRQLLPSATPTPSGITGEAYVHQQHPRRPSE